MSEQPGAVRVTVKLFATLREQAGWSEQQIVLAPGATLGDLMAQLTAQHPKLTLTGRAVYAAVNQQYVQPGHVLANGDIVALFPPVSGGQAAVEERANE
jgi:molybdopterin synthase catalytic subunit